MQTASASGGPRLPTGASPLDPTGDFRSQTHSPPQMNIPGAGIVNLCS